MGGYCALHGCLSSRYDKKRSFYRFPKDEKRLKLWLTAADRSDLMNISAEKLNASYVLCDLHFLETDRYRRKLKRNAIPTQNLPKDFLLRSKSTQTEYSISENTLTKEASPTSISRTPSVSTATTKDLSAASPRNRKLFIEYNTECNCKRREMLQLEAQQGCTAVYQNECDTSPLNEQDTQPGPSGNSPCENTSSEPDDWDSIVYGTGFEDALGHTSLNQCRFCGEYNNDCVNFTDNYKPYIKSNKTLLKLNDMSIELDFNDVLPKTVCRICDRRLQVMFEFVKEVKEAQDALIKLRNNGKEEVEIVVVKTECESPAPDEDEDDEDIKNEIDSEVNDDIKDETVDSVNVTETEFVKQTPFISNKRKSVKDTPKTKKLKTTKYVGNENELMIDIKKETVEIDEAYEAEYLELQNELMIEVKEETAEIDKVHKAECLEFSDTETDDKLSEIRLDMRALANKITHKEKPS